MHRKTSHFDGVVYDEKLFDLDKQVSKAVHATIQEICENPNKREDINNWVSVARINDTHRLFFATITVNDKKYLIILRAMLNHDYQKEPLTDEQYAKEYIEGHTPGWIAFTQASIKRLSELASVGQRESSSQLKYAPIIPYGERLLVFNEQQTEGLMGALPMMVMGAAGTGKTGIAFALLQKLAQLAADPNLAGKPILYVTESALLKDEIEKMWFSLELPPHVLQRVKFWTYEQEILNKKEKINETKESSKKPVDFKHFAAWCEKQESKDQPVSADLLYQEMRTLCTHSEESYLQLGKKKTLFSDRALRKKIWDYAQTYFRYLKDNGIIDLSFYTPQKLKKGAYSHVIIDEAHDFSDHQLEILASLAHQGNVAAFMDMNQSLKDEISKEDFLKNTLQGEDKKEVTHVILKKGYRCPAKVGQFATRFMGIQNYLGGVAGKSDAVEVDVSEQKFAGRVYWFTKELSETNQSILKKAAQHSQFMVLTWPELVEKAKESYGTQLVQTSARVKGLEGEVIVLPDLLNHPDCKKVSQALAGVTLEDIEKKRWRPKKDEESQHLATVLHHIITAVTRSRGIVIVVQKIDHTIENLFNLAQQSLDILVNAELDLSPLHEVASNWEKRNEEWKKIERVSLLAEMEAKENENLPTQTKQSDGKPANKKTRAQQRSAKKRRAKDKSAAQSANHKPAEVKETKEQEDSKLTRTIQLFSGLGIYPRTILGAPNHPSVTTAEFEAFLGNKKLAFSFQYIGGICSLTLEGVEGFALASAGNREDATKDCCNLALAKMRNDEKYFKYFLVTLPEDKDNALGDADVLEVFLRANSPYYQPYSFGIWGDPKGNRISISVHDVEVIATTYKGEFDVIVVLRVLFKELSEILSGFDTLEKVSAVECAITHERERRAQDKLNMILRDPADEASSALFNDMGSGSCFFLDVLLHHTRILFPLFKDAGCFNLIKIKDLTKKRINATTILLELFKKIQVPIATDISVECERFLLRLRGILTDAALFHEVESSVFLYKISSSHDGLRVLSSWMQEKEFRIPPEKLLRRPLAFDPSIFDNFTTDAEYGHDIICDISSSEAFLKAIKPKNLTCPFGTRGGSVAANMLLNPMTQLLSTTLGTKFLYGYWRMQPDFFAQVPWVFFTTKQSSNKVTVLHKMAEDVVYGHQFLKDALLKTEDLITNVTPQFLTEKLNDDQSFLTQLLKTSSGRNIVVFIIQVNPQLLSDELLKPYQVELKELVSAKALVASHAQKNTKANDNSQALVAKDSGSSMAFAESKQFK